MVIIPPHEVWSVAIHFVHVLPVVPVLLLLLPALVCVSRGSAKCFRLVVPSSEVHLLHAQIPRHVLGVPSAPKLAKRSLARRVMGQEILRIRGLVVLEPGVPWIRGLRSGSFFPALCRAWVRLDRRAPETS